jgi:hypothetical protein
MAMEGNGGIIASLPEAVQTVHDTAANAAANAANVAANAVATSQHDSSHNWWTTAGTHCHSNIIRSLILIDKLLQSGGICEWMMIAYHVMRLLATMNGSFTPVNELRTYNCGAPVVDTVVVVVDVDVDVE